MDATGTDRRVHARFEPAARADARATLRPGCAIALVDVSAGGALVEGPRPMRPGAKVHLQVTTASRQFAIAAQVLRCAVWSLDPLTGVTYRGALQFEQRVEWAWAESGRHAAAMPEQLRPTPAKAGKQLPQNQRVHHPAARD
ncbi:hypothetical protein BH24ACI5_BH24ACI5_01650 [soil metagenome]